MNVRARVVIIGGYGNTGLRVARLLASRPDVELVVAGRQLDKARSAAAALSPVASHRVRIASADVRRAADRRALFAGATLVLAASSTTEVAADIARDALDAGADAYDTNLSSADKVAALQALADDAVRLGRTVITDGGFHPGLPGVLVRHAAELVPSLTDAHVGGAFSLDWNALSFSPATVSEFVDELTQMNPEVYKKGRWTRSWSAMRAFDFGVGGGARQCTPWALQEMRDLPADIPSLRNAGFYIAGFSTLIDLVVMPAALLALRLAPSRRESIGRLFLASLRKWASRGEWAVLLLEGEGGTPRHRVRIRVAHRDPYDLTAAPIVACIEQLLDGSRRPGVFTQSSFVHPARFLHRLQGLGVSVQTLVSPVD